jgi:GH35 family endo-1,4-beta-xylanase
MKIRITPLALLLGWFPPLAIAAEPLDALWANPAVEKRIDSGIRTNRMSAAVVTCVDAQGLPLADVSLRIEQTRHEFLFGANIFMLNGFKTPEENRQFEKAFCSIFNYATAPFYWDKLEPEQDKPRFAKDSPAIYRRPPPDAVLEFCQKNRIVMKGHVLVYAQFVPEWTPKEPIQYMQRLERRIAEIAARYGNSIRYWDVVNEAMTRTTHPQCPLPDDFIYKSLDYAAKVYPANSVLMVNEATEESWNWYRGPSSPYYLILKDLLKRGARIDVIGMQMHIMSERYWQATKAGVMYTPEEMFKVIDLYSKLGRPIQVSEITIPVRPDTVEGELDQAAVARNFYRLWFSSASVEAITWWNLVDGTAHESENALRGGLLNKDFSQKPVFKALDQLINHDWKTTIETKSSMKGTAAFSGFRGEYTVTAQSGKQTVKHTFQLEKGTPNEWTVRF